LAMARFSSVIEQSREKPLNTACSGLGGGPCKKAESKRKHFSVSLLGSPTKPVTRGVGRFLITLKLSSKYTIRGHAKRTI
jgi:hypothetical protein